MRVLVIGCGVIGQRVAEASEGLARVKRVYLFDIDKERAEAVASILPKAETVDSVEDVVEEISFAVEAANQDAVATYAPMLLEHGVPLLLMSVGALADEELRVGLDEKALAHNARIYIPSGAI
ncbi:MAG: aspartate dehydrogenase, partial [Thermoplasmata archaeon]|nr:aspartate dehydrogenase [Thermoplasmata archaeon]